MTNNVLKYRKEKGFTQRELSQRVSCARETISSIERGRNAPNIELVLGLARELDCTVNNLFEI